MKSVALLVLLSGTIGAIPPIYLDKLSKPVETVPIETVKKKVTPVLTAEEGPPREKDVHQEALKVDHLNPKEISRSVQSGCIEYTGEMLNSNLTKEERELARWRLANLQRHPFFDFDKYERRSEGRFPHSDEYTY